MREEASPHPPTTHMRMLWLLKMGSPDSPHGHVGRQGGEWPAGNQGPLARMERNTCRAVNGGSRHRGAEFELLSLTLNEFQDTDLWRTARCAPEWNIPHQGWRDALPVTGHSPCNISPSTGTSVGHSHVCLSHHLPGADLHT